MTAIRIPSSTADLIGLDAQLAQAFVQARVRRFALDATVPTVTRSAAGAGSAIASAQTFKSYDNTNGRIYPYFRYSGGTPIQAKATGTARDYVAMRVLKRNSLPISGVVQLDLTQQIPTSNTAQTVGDALNAARAVGFGKAVWNPLANPPTVTIYAADDTTVIRTFVLDDAFHPRERV
jgi:hypothetical protein